MRQSLNGKNIAAFAMRMCLLLLLVSSALLVTGCADLSSDDRAVFYNGWTDPKSNTLIQ
ncbi:MAG: hypothetical protein ABSD58_03100 [Verrucomicrobiia bacterium]|jgi:hypothetical protein